jgi:hypothetical protein
VSTTCRRFLFPVLALTATVAICANPPTASAFNPAKPLCKAAGIVSGVVGKLCTVASHPGRIVDAGKKLAHGKLGSAAKSLLGDAGGASAATKALGLAAVGAWVIGGASFSLRQTAKVLSATTTPQLTSTWFSSAYWRMAAIAALLTLPFLCAATVQAILHSDLALLARAALGYLPLSMLAVAVAAPLATLLLAASDQMSSVVSAAAGNAGGHFLDGAGLRIAGLAAGTHSPFIAFFVGLFTVAGTLMLWLELLMREAAVYVIVLMLPVVFAALVWPARRVWATRAAELLVALILSKFAIVAVLALGGAALSHGLGNGVAALLAGLVLVLLGAFAPWALLRLLPLHELASGAVGSLRAEGRPALHAAQLTGAMADDGDHWLRNLHARMRPDADEVSGLAAGRGAGRGELEQFAGTTGQRSDPDTPGESDHGAGAAADEEAGVAERQPAGVAHEQTPPAAEAGTAPQPRTVPEPPTVPETESPVLELGPDGVWFQAERPGEERPSPYWTLPEPSSADAGTGEDGASAADRHDELPPKQDPGGRCE